MARKKIDVKKVRSVGVTIAKRVASKAISSGKRRGIDKRIREGVLNKHNSKGKKK